MSDNARSRNPMPEVAGGEARFLDDADFIGRQEPIGAEIVADVESDTILVIGQTKNPELIEALATAGKSDQDRLNDKIEAAWLGDVPKAKPFQRWHQAEDGTYFSASFPDLTVVVERTNPADLAMIHVVGQTQEMNPGAARWLSLRLAEAAAIVETAVIP